MKHYYQVGLLYEALVSGDNSLNAYVFDGRRSNPIMLTPIEQDTYTPEPIQPVMPEPVAPVAQPVMPAPVAVEPVKPVITQRPQIEMASIPDTKWADLYINRKMFGKTDFELLDVIKANKQNLLIRGHAGSGKTVCVMAWSASRGYRYYNVSSNIGLEPSHLFGMWTPTEDAGVFRWQDGPVTDLVRNGGVLLLNEIDFMPERITTVLFGLLDDRREIQLLENGGEVIKAHPDLVVIGDHNPNYRGSRPMNQAWKDRFAHKWEFEYDKAIEKRLVKNASLLEVADKLRAMADKGELDTPVSTRGLVAFGKNVENVSLDYAVTSYVNGFSDDEREAIKLVLDTAKANIGSDYGLTVAVGATQSDED
jgi:MoxR-like ATPase